MKNFRIKDLMITVVPDSSLVRNHALLITDQCPGPTKCGKTSTPDCSGPTQCGKVSTPDCGGPTICGKASTPDCGGPTICGKASTPDCGGPTICGKASKPDCGGPTKGEFLKDIEFLKADRAAASLFNLKKTLAGMQATKKTILVD